jgi:hypothetical protein
MEAWTRPEAAAPGATEIAGHGDESAQRGVKAEIRPRKLSRLWFSDFADDAHGDDEKVAQINGTVTERDEALL